MQQYAPQYVNVPTGYRLVPDQNYQPYQNPWRNPYESITKPQGIPGRMVSSPDEIRPNETPSDGTAAFFPSSDYTKIYARQMTSNGTIASATYVLETPKETEPPAQNTTIDLSPLSDRLSKIEETLERLRNIWEPQDAAKTQA